MGLFKKKIESAYATRPSVPTAPVSPWGSQDSLQVALNSELFGVDDRAITRDIAMRVPGLKRAVQIHADVVAAMPLIQYKDGAKVATQPRWLQNSNSGIPPLIRTKGLVKDLALEGGAEVIQAFFEGVVDSYAKVTDLDALRAVFAAAAGTDLARLVAPGTYPGVAGHDYPKAMGMVIQAIEAISDADDDAASVVVNPTAWNQLLFTPKDLVPEYVSFGVTAGTGEGNSEGKVIIKKAADEFFPGLDPVEPAVLGGAKNAIEFREQGSTPIQVDALDIARGGVDKAVIGYLETFLVRAESLVLIGTEDA